MKRKVISIVYSMICLAFLGFIGFISCKTVAVNPDTQVQATEIAYHMVTWRVINNDVDKAKFIAEQSQMLIDAIEKGSITQVSVIQEAIKKLANQMNLAPMEVMALQDLIGLFTEDLNVPDIPQAEQIKTIVLPRLKWINDAATRMQEYL